MMRCGRGGDSKASGDECDKVDSITNGDESNDDTYEPCDDGVTVTSANDIIDGWLGEEVGRTK